jgi:hypothetical protein
MSRTAWQRKAPDAYWKQGDTAPAIAEQLFDGTGTPVVLTGATVKFIGAFRGQASPEISAAATITDAATGKVSYTPVTADTDTPGSLLVEWQVTFAGGAIETFPNSDYQKVVILTQVGS